MTQPTNNHNEQQENKNNIIPEQREKSKTKWNRFNIKKKKASEKKESFAFKFNVTYRVISSLMLIMILTIIAAGVFFVGVGSGYFASLVSNLDVPDKEELAQKINDAEQQSKILYSNGELISVIKSDLIRTSVKSDEISPLIKEALVSTEDENFYEHDGVVPKAIIRAAISDLTGLGGSSGGSTITQQLIKQQVLTNEASYKRKAPEILMAMKAEEYFSKDDILTAYLNVSPFGRNNQGENIAGVEEAAMGIFGVHASEVTIPQAAFIAGLPQSPINYSPYTNTGEFKENFDAGMTRKNEVLFNMYREKMINEKEYNEAKDYDLASDFKQPEDKNTDDRGFLYNHLYEEAATLLAPIYYKKDGVTDQEYEESDTIQAKYDKIVKRELRQNGYTIHSTIDEGINKAMQDAVSDYGYLLDDGRDETIETGSILMDNKTGRIYGFIGGRDYGENQWNHAFQSTRSPGSTIKPIIAYAPAIDVGLIGSESMLSDYEKKYSNGQQINNYSDKGSNSFKTVRDSIKNSLNIPVVNLYSDLITKTDTKTYFDKMNITSLTDDEFKNESIPLGGTTNGITVKEEAAAYATLANKGVFNDGYTIDKITDNAGNTVYEHESDPVTVFKPSTASIMNDLMRDVVNSGTGMTAKTTLTNLGSPLANADWVGKTGTSENETDFWFTASTPNVTLSNWIGYDESSTMYSSWGKNNMEFWAYIANNVYQNNPDIFGVDETFTLDSTVNKQKVVAATGEKPGSFNTDGYSISTTDAKTTTSYFSEGKEAPAAQFKFGIGGSDDNYKSFWDAYLKENKSQKNTTKKSN